MLPSHAQKAFLRAVHGEITEDEAAEKIADLLCAKSPSSSQDRDVTDKDRATNANNAKGVQIQQITGSEKKMNISGPVQQQQQKVLGTITLGDLQPAQITQFQQAFAEASKGLATSVVFSVPARKGSNPEDEFTEKDKERCSLLQELIVGHRPLILHPYVFLLNRRFKWTDIAVPVSDTDKFRVYRLNQARNARCYYRCSGCETMAKESGDPVAQIKLAEGHLAGDVNPLHNPKCELFTFSAIINRQFDREARLDVYNGIMAPKEAWNRGHLRALRAESLAPKGLVSADDYPTWETMNKVIMKLWRSAKRAHDAGAEVNDRVGNKDWWRNIPPPVVPRRNLKRDIYEDVTNYDSHQAGAPRDSGEMEEFDDDGGHSCISMAASGGTGCVELLDVVSENEVYTTDQEPTSSGTYGKADVPPEPPEEISLFSENQTDPSKQTAREDSKLDVARSSGGNDTKTAEALARNSEDSANVQYYLTHDDDDDDEDDDDDDDDNDGDEDDNDVDVDNDEQIDVDNGDEDDEVMREYHDILNEVQQLEREARAATENVGNYRRMNGGRTAIRPQREQSYTLRRSMQRVSVRERTTAQQRLSNNTFFANRKLFAAIESLTRTLNKDHSRQFHQEMLKTAVELSNHYSAQQQQQYATSTAAKRNATVEHRNVSAASNQQSDVDSDEKSFGKVIGRRQVAASPLRTWAFKKLKLEE